MLLVRTKKGRNLEVKEKKIPKATRKKRNHVTKRGRRNPDRGCIAKRKARRAEEKYEKHQASRRPEWSQSGAERGGLEIL